MNEPALFRLSKILLDSPLYSTPKAVNIWLIRLMKKIHKQLSRGFSENVHGEVQFS